jgi:hypothetical protein
VTSELYSEINIQKHTREWLKDASEKFDTPIIGTLTFAYGVSASSASKQLKVLHHKLSKYVFKNAYNNHKKMVRFIPFLEGINDDEHHIHFIVDSHHKNVHDFIGKLNTSWIQGIKDLEPLNDNLSSKWINYISKMKSKARFSDALILNCTTL